MDIVDIQSNPVDLDGTLGGLDPGLVDMDMDMDE